MKVRIEEIKEKGLSLEAEEPVADYPALVELEESGEGHFLAPLHIHLDLKKEYGHVRASGRVETIVRLACSCCLAEFDHTIDTRFTIFYTKAMADIPQDEEVELKEEDLVSTTYEADEIDFTAEITEQTILEIPYKALCREDCRGLCSKCGADLNVTDCGCDRQDYNLKFSALKNFKLDR